MAGALCDRLQHQMSDLRTRIIALDTAPESERDAEQLAALEIQLKQATEQRRAALLAGEFEFPLLPCCSSTPGARICALVVFPEGFLKLRPCQEASESPQRDLRRCDEDNDGTHWHCFHSLMPATRRRALEELELACVRDVHGTISSRIPYTAQQGIWLQFRDGTALPLVVKEPTRLVDVLGAHMLQLRSRKLNMARQLSQLTELKKLKFDQHNKEHVCQLQQLWQNTFPAAAEIAVDDHTGWTRLGFSPGAGPWVDFRGTGVLGLQCVSWMALHYPRRWRSIVDWNRHGDQQYRLPVICAAVNVTASLFDLLGAEKQIQELISRDGGDGVRALAV